MPFSKFQLKQFGDLNPIDNAADSRGKAVGALNVTIENPGIIRALEGASLFADAPTDFQPLDAFFYTSIDKNDTLFLAGNGKVGKTTNLSSSPLTVDENVGWRVPLTGTLSIPVSSSEATITLNSTGYAPQLQGFKAGDIVKSSTFEERVLGMQDNGTILTITNTGNLTPGSVSFELIASIQSTFVRFAQIADRVIVVPGFDMPFTVFPDGFTLPLLLQNPFGNVSTSNFVAGTTKYIYLLTYSAKGGIIETPPWEIDILLDDNASSSVRLDFSTVVVPQWVDSINLYRMRVGTDDDFFLISSQGYPSSASSEGFGWTFTFIDTFSQFDPVKAQVWENPTTDNAVLPSWFTATRFRNALAVGNLMDDQGAIFFSEPFKEWSFKAFSFHKFQEDGGEVLSLAETEQGLIVGRDRDVYVLEGEIGNMRQRLLHSFGIGNPDAMVQDGGIVYFVSQDGFYATNGASVTALHGEDVRRYFIEKVNRENLLSSNFGVHKKYLQVAV